jgi:hypothetical protein
MSKDKKNSCLKVGWVSLDMGFSLCFFFIKLFFLFFNYKGYKDFYKQIVKIYLFVLFQIILIIKILEREH